jgi:hypothetical protein
MAVLASICMMFALVACVYRLSVWVRTAASQRIKTWVTVSILTIVLIGMFLRLPVWVASILSVFVIFCVAADALVRRRRESDIAG